MRKNLLIASLIGAGLLLWLISGALGERPEPMADTRSTASPSGDDAPVVVRVEQLNAQQRTLTRVLRGKTESKRLARVSAETSGRVVRRPVERGDRVDAGQVLCELAIDEREAEVSEAKASVESAAIEFRGAKELRGQDLVSEIQIAQLGANLEAARAQLKRQELKLQRARITAPFDGFVEQLHLDVGDLATVGSLCATLIDLDPLLIEANVSERDIEFIKVGSAVSARTSTNQRLEGQVSFVGNQSDEMTRTYPVEITVPNPDFKYRAGLTTVVSVETDTVLAHRVSPALFTLDDAGVIGLRAVDRDDRVVFHPVTIVEDAAEGAWVTGLPGVVRLITVGQEFVTSGQRVEVKSNTRSPTTASLQ